MIALVKVENIVRKRGYQHLLLFSHCFQNHFLYRLYKSFDCLLKNESLKMKCCFKIAHFQKAGLAIQKSRYSQMLIYTVKTVLETILD